MTGEGGSVDEQSEPLDKYQFGDSRDLIRARAESAGIEYAVVEWGADEADPDPYLLEVLVPNGREHRTFGMDAGRAEEFAGSNFEHVTFLGDYNAVYDRKKNSIEAVIKATRTIFTARRFGRVPGVEFYDQQNSEWKSLTERVEASGGGLKFRDTWRLSLTEEGAPFAVEISAPSPEFKCLMGDRDLPSPPNLVMTLKVQGVSETRHNPLLDLLESIAASLFFELDLRFDIVLSLGRVRRISSNSFRRDLREHAQHPVSLPRNRYAKEAITLYSYGRAALGTPLLQYLAYYQAIEYFFPSFFNAKLLTRVRNELRDPTFDSESDAHLQRIVNLASSGKRGVAVLEKEQLGATLEGSIDEQQVRELINGIAGMAKFFADKSSIRFVSTVVLSNKSEILSQIVDRVYQIRCRIVHAKSDGGPRDSEVLLPFSAEANRLEYDLILIRFLCQKVIISGSRGRLW